MKSPTAEARSGVALAICCLLCLIGSPCCTTVLYQGPKRAPEELATIASGTDTWIRKIDGTEVSDHTGYRFEVLPGRHSIHLVGSHVIPGVFVTRTVSSKRIAICLRAKPGETYTVKASLDDGRWTLTADEGSSGENVAYDCSLDRP